MCVLLWRTHRGNFSLTLLPVQFLFNAYLPATRKTNRKTCLRCVLCFCAMPACRLGCAGARRRFRDMYCMYFYPRCDRGPASQSVCRQDCEELREECGCQVCARSLVSYLGLFRFSLLHRCPPASFHFVRVQSQDPSGVAQMDCIQMSCQDFPKENCYRLATLG